MKKIFSLITSVIWLNVSLCYSQGSVTNRTYFDDSYKTVSSYNVGGNTIALEKKLYMYDYRANGDGTRFYRTTLAVAMKSGSKAERTIIETDVYTEANYSKGSLPCMMIDPKKQVLYIFANSKGPDRYYGMEGYVYKIDMQTQRWSKETVFTRANFGWFSFFGGSNNGNPELWHFSFAGYRAMKSVRNYNGTWSNYDMGGIRPEQADAQYGYHKNILVTSSSGVDKMYLNTTNYATNSSSSSNQIVPGISDRTLIQGAALVGAGALIYGLFKWLGSGLRSSSSSSSSYGSYSSSSSSYRSSSSSSSSSSSNTSSQQNYSCRVHLKFRDGDEVYKGHVTAYFKGFMTTTKTDFYTDKNGYATISWPKEKGEVIDCLVLDRNIGFYDTYTKEGLRLENKGSYEICMDCK